MAWCFFLGQRLCGLRARRPVRGQLADGPCATGSFLAVPGAAMPVLRRRFAAQRHLGRRADQVQADDNRHE